MCRSLLSSNPRFLHALSVIASLCGLLACSDDSQSNSSTAGAAGDSNSNAGASSGQAGSLAAGTGGTGGSSNVGAAAGEGGTSGGFAGSGGSGAGGATGGAGGSAATGGNGGLGGVAGTSGNAGSSGTAGSSGNAGSAGTAGTGGSGGSSSSSLPPGIWTPNWQLMTGDDNVQRVDRLAVDPLGNVALSIAYRGSLSLGGTTLDDLGTQGPAYAIARLDNLGNPIFARRLVNTSDMGVTHVSAAADGSTLVSGWFTGSIDLGAGPILTPLTQDSFVALYNPMGELTWSRTFGDTSVVNSSVMLTGAVYSAGEIIVAGTASESVLLDTPTVIQGGFASLFTARLSLDGSVVPMGSAIFEGAHGIAYAIAPRAGGGALVAGQFLGTFEIAGALYNSQPPSNIQDFADAYIVAFDSSLGVSWSSDLRQLGKSTQPAAVVEGADGTSWIVGTTSFTTPSDSYDHDAFVASFDSQGALTWNQRLGNANSAQFGLAITAESTGTVLIAGSFEDAVVLPNGSVLHSAGSTDAFIFRCTPEQQVSHALALGDDGSQVITSIETLPNASTVIGGGFTGVLTFAQTSLNAGADEDAFVAVGALGD